MKNSPFFKQANLLVQLIPFVNAETCFALKGGTAINFFVRNFPRLSVDIDLVYMPIEDRATSLNGIEMVERIRRSMANGASDGTDLTCRTISMNCGVLKLCMWD